MSEPGRSPLAASPADVVLANALRTRHADTLGGALLSLNAVRAARVVLTISAASACTLAGQHLLLQLANLLGRMEGVIDTIEVCIDGGDLPLQAGVDPRQPEGSGSLRAAAEMSATLAAPHRLRMSEGEAQTDGTIGVRVGAPPAPGVARVSAVNGRAIHVWAAASDWLAFVGRDPGPDCSPEAELPFGSYCAAALAAAEVFRLVRAAGQLSGGPPRLAFSAWSWAVDEGPLADGPTAPSIAACCSSGIAPFTLVGVGAVGSAFLLALWASGMAVPDAVAVDGDEISWTNLNRYVLFGVGDLDMPKAHRASALLERGGAAPFTLRSDDAWWADYRRRESVPIPLLVSAVDKNTVRHQLQDALPRIILGASTHSLRAQVDRYDLSDPRSPCLKCHNPPELVETDAETHARLVRMDDKALRAESKDRGVDYERLVRYVTDLRSGGAGCAIVTGEDLEKLRHSNGEGAFAVSFVSALAGTLLAAQLMREVVGEKPVLAPGRSRGNFQLWRPLSHANAPRTVAAQSRCWCSGPAPRAAHTEMWPQRR